MRQTAHIHRLDNLCPLGMYSVTRMMTDEVTSVSRETEASIVNGKAECIIKRKAERHSIPEFEFFTSHQLQIHTFSSSNGRMSH